MARLDTSAPDRDSARLGALARLSMLADDLREQAAAANRLKSRAYRAAQSAIYAEALKTVKAANRGDADD